MFFSSGIIFDVLEISEAVCVLKYDNRPLMLYAAINTDYCTAIAKPIFRKRKAKIFEIDQ